jgi:tetratricopeptide (TPR) repeat protein
MPHPARACGPDFPNSILVGGDESVLWTPLADFKLNVDRFIDEVSAPFPYLPVMETDWDEYYGEVRVFNVADQTRVKDLDELNAALEKAGIAGPDRTRIFNEYIPIRAGLQRYAETMVDIRQGSTSQETFEARWHYFLNWDLRTWSGNEADNPTGVSLGAYMPLENVEPPVGLPPEFELYLRGAFKYYLGEWGQARAYWQELLQLPPDQRHYRSTWAAFMIGKSQLSSDPAGSVESFQMVRSLAGDGFADSLGLASSSFVWEARSEKSLGRFTDAIESYIRLYRAGDESALTPVRPAIRAAFAAGPDALKEAAANPTVRKTISAYVSANCRGGGGWPGPYITIEQAGQWLDAINEIAGDDSEDADLIALACYESGRFDTAQGWLDRSPDTPLSMWIRAKLALRAGDLTTASAYLKQAFESFPSDDVWVGGEIGETYDIPGLSQTGGSPSLRILAELGAVQLHLGQYTEALDSLLDSGYWWDAAYIAESVLSVDELMEYVDRTWPEPPGPSYSHMYTNYWWNSQYPADPDLAAYRVRYLLARRLARLDRWTEARPYYPENQRSRMDAYFEFVRRANDPSRTADQHIDDFWNAAQVARHEGMELMGTELEPDWFVVEGGYDLESYVDIRVNSRQSEVLLGSTEDEAARAERNREEIQPFKRFHYRYIACDLAWKSINMMPDESDETAERLCIAGRWLLNWDFDVSVEFWRALAHRCGTTELGGKARLWQGFPQCGSDWYQPIEP